MAIPVIEDRCVCAKRGSLISSNMDQSESAIYNLSITTVHLQLNYSKEIGFQYLEPLNGGNKHMEAEEIQCATCLECTGMTSPLLS